MEFFLKIIMVLLLCLSASEHAFAWKLRVDGVENYFITKASGYDKSKVSFLDSGIPIHEELTIKAIGCEFDKEASRKAVSVVVKNECLTRLEDEGLTPESLLRGVRWNDFPSVWLNKQSPICDDRILRVSTDAGCFIRMYAWASTKKNVTKETNFPLGSRGHFGDLQFLHSMAPMGEKAVVTKSKIYDWVRFAYAASYGTYGLKSDAYDIPELRRFVIKGSRKVGDLLDYCYDGNTKSCPKYVTRGVALGQIFHIIQDSFAGCHVDRDLSGKIIKFYTYKGQDFKKHGDADENYNEGAFNTADKIDPVSITQEIFKFRQSGSFEETWPSVISVLDRAFQLNDNNATSEPGDGCRLESSSVNPLIGLAK